MRGFPSSTPPSPPGSREDAALVSGAGLEADASPPYDEQRFPHLLQDYQWAVRMGLLTPTEDGWQTWVEGYEAGEEIAMRVANRARGGGS